ncbi:DUF3575 domain-containing protein [Hymenobacter sp. BT770]|uniref:DUF3575 domain-containing protein n=1 Tax=Hymenobacter sp. BT770 TaxID=2886942 RepID=UPI001D109DB4|nr:DUF3575 domain-containing protein [Hymenobacter sp. BT770]MCC3153263.1 DUF3575 domain-containing protein [Hymenobacter sp. BT770]MDO3414258.1 DUF3575 domain-containing protein [Hymenobacter sp. BT770]
MGESISAAGQTSAPVPLRSHVLTVGFRGGNCGVGQPAEYTLGFETALSTRFRLHTGVGYNQQTIRSHDQYIVYHPDSTPLEEASYNDHSRTRRRHVSLTTQVRYVLERGKAPGVGLYVGGGVVGTYETRSMTHTDVKLGNENFQAWRAQAALHIGRQWALGSRLALDTFIGGEAIVLGLRDRGQSRSVGHLPFDTLLTPTAGAAVGYRF